MSSLAELHVQGYNSIYIKVHENVTRWRKLAKDENNLKTPV